MSIFVHIQKIDHGTIHVMADQKVVAVVKGEVMDTKEKREFIKMKFNEKTGRDEEEKTIKIIDGPKVDTLLEKTKCIVEWLNCEYKVGLFGPLIGFKV